MTGNRGVGCNVHRQTVWLDSRCCGLKRSISSRYKLGQPLAITIRPVEGVAGVPAEALCVASYVDSSLAATGCVCIVAGGSRA